jgi:predicted dehydrogenase
LTGLRVEAVSAICGNQIHQYPDVEDAGTAIMKMSNGAIFSVASNFNISYDAGGSSFGIYGTKGSVTASRTLGQTETGTVHHINLESGHADPVIISFDDKNMYTKQIEAFSDAIMKDLPAPVSAEDGIIDQRIVEAIYESHEKGIHIYLR